MGFNRMRNLATTPHACPSFCTPDRLHKPAAAVFSYCQWGTAVPSAGKYIKRDIKTNTHVGMIMDRMNRIDRIQLALPIM